MIERLFVYGSLGPGRPNEHVLAVIGGNWQSWKTTRPWQHASMPFATECDGDRSRSNGDASTAPPNVSEVVRLVVSESGQ